MRRIDDQGVFWGEMGGNMDWKMVVVSDSSCWRTGFGSFSVVCGLLKLFMTSRGGEINSFPPPLGCFWALIISLHKEYFSIRKCSVGPRGVSAMRRFMRLDLER